MHWILWALLVYWIISSLILLGAFLWAGLGLRHWILIIPVILTFGWLMIILMLLYVFIGTVIMKNHNPHDIY